MIGNLAGAMVGGMALGVIEVLSVAYLASSYRDAFAVAMMIGILLFRPEGLLPRRMRDYLPGGNEQRAR